MPRSCEIHIPPLWRGLYKNLTGFKNLLGLPPNSLKKSLDVSDYIKWETNPVPIGKQSGRLTFLMLAGIDVNSQAETFVKLAFRL